MAIESRNLRQLAIDLAQERLWAGINGKATANQIAILISEAVAASSGRPEVILTISDLRAAKRKRNEGKAEDGNR